MTATSPACSRSPPTRAERGAGHGRRLVLSALKWARLRGAREAWLQVEADNDAGARRSTRSLGFREVYRYHYRRPPGRADVTGAGKRILLVAACALVDADGRVLLAQRPEGKPLAGLWEFPGGKVEPGETPEEALIRELREESASRPRPRAWRR